MKTGQSVAVTWPKDMKFAMNPERPKDVALTDYMPNSEGFVLASPRLATFLRDQKFPDVEFLPVTILDHKKRVASKDYTIFHSYHVVDCVDQKASDFKWDGLENPSMVVKKLVLKQDVLGEGERIVRPKFTTNKVLYRSDLREALDKEKFTGLGFSRELFGDFKVYRPGR